MSSTASILDVTDAAFERDVIERSKDVPVVVDFWAAWCGPCRALSPVLEKLALEADGSWILAKVDVDANPGAAQAFQIQGIPAVKAFKDGRVVAEFTGALPEPHVRSWLERLGPSRADLLVEEGRAAEERGEGDEALRCYRDALALEPAHEGAHTHLARLELNLRARSADLDALKQRLHDDPADVEAATDAADALMAHGEVDQALSVDLDSVAATSGEEREVVRRHLLTLLDTLEPDDPRGHTARRRLSRLLF